MNIEIRNFSYEYWDEFVCLINHYWKENHPIINRELFDWQYQGYGPMKGIERSKLLFIDGKIQGFRGVIPGQYQLLNSETLLNGCSFAVWIVVPEHRGKGLGYALMERIGEEFNVMCSLGSNEKTSVPIYRRNKFAYIDSLFRFVIPLDLHGYKLLSDPRMNSQSIIKWFESLSFGKSIAPVSINAKLLADLWLHISSKTRFFGLYKTEDFWNWRYIQNFGFKYYFFGDPIKIGVIIGRIECVLTIDSNEPSDQKVFRIMEVLPVEYSAWENEPNQKMIELLKNVLSWAKEMGCAAADFQISNSKLSSTLISAGFRLQDNSDPLLETSLASLFQPFRLKSSPINGTYFIKNHDGKIIELDREDTYFVKSDNDMDRTNFWPIIQ